MGRVGLLASFAVVVTTTIPAAAAQPQPLPAHNGWIAFASDRPAFTDRPYRLYRLEPVGGAVTPLGLTGRQPAWSPDGTLLAFVQDRFKLVITRASGTRVRTLESDDPLADPAWSPEGSRIVVTVQIGGRFRNDLALVDLPRPRFARITRTADDDTEPTWSPDGRSIAFVSDRAQEPGVGDSEIYAISLGSHRIRRITTNDFEDRSPAWSPDGTRIAFVSGREPQGQYPELWTMRPDGSGATRVQPASRQESWGIHSWTETSPAWSPDGRWLAYMSTQRWYLEDIYIVEVDAGTKIDLEPESTSFDLEPAWQPVCIVAGTSAGDTVRGTELSELVCGFDGNDTLVGGRGSDRLFGGFGNDRIRARDGEFDVVGCGAGRDSVLVDRRDLVASDCENVRRR